MKVFAYYSTEYAAHVYTLTRLENGDLGWLYISAIDDPPSGAILLPLLNRRRNVGNQLFPTIREFFEEDLLTCG